MKMYVWVLPSVADVVAILAPDMKTARDLAWAAMLGAAVTFARGVREQE